MKRFFKALVNILLLLSAPFWLGSVLLLWSIYFLVTLDSDALRVLGGKVFWWEL